MQKKIKYKQLFSTFLSFLYFYGLRKFHQKIKTVIIYFIVRKKFSRIACRLDWDGKRRPLGQCY